MDLVFASTNPNKAQEVRALLAPYAIAVRAASELMRELPEVAEDAATFEGNAEQKALAYARALGVVCLADDSGVEVEGLGGAPGVHSARYAKVEGTRAQRDRANRVKLLAELAARGDASRRARLVCALCLADASGRVLYRTAGSVDVMVTSGERGDGGFGYDSVLLVPSLHKTIAELDHDEWNRISHRAAAIRALAEHLVRLQRAPQSQV